CHSEQAAVRSRTKRRIGEGFVAGPPCSRDNRRFMRWSLTEAIRARLADEQGTLHKQAETRIALCYPSPYHVGMSSLGFQTIYREIHQHQGASAERAFLPDDVEAW